MRTSYIFLAGMEKCGTTPLAGWLTANGIAQYLVEDVKEPHSYLIPGTQPQLPAPAQLPWLDASVGYSHSPYAISRLPEREKLVIALYYYENLTLREIGEVLGVTESRVSQLHTKAVLRLKARLQSEVEA